MKHMKCITLLYASALALFVTSSHTATARVQGTQRQDANNTRQTQDIRMLRAGDKLPKPYADAGVVPTHSQGIRAKIVINEENWLRLYYVDHNNKIVEPPFETVNIEYQRRVNLDPNTVGAYAGSSYNLSLKRLGSEPALVGRGSASTADDLYNIRVTYSTEAGAQALPPVQTSAGKKKAKPQHQM